MIFFTTKSILKVFSKMSRNAFVLKWQIKVNFVKRRDNTVTSEMSVDMSNFTKVQKCVFPKWQNKADLVETKKLHLTDETY